MPSPINLENDGAYFYVELGPIPGVPTWHDKSNPSRWPFPTLAAALRFAEAHERPGRDIVIRCPDGEVFS